MKNKINSFFIQTINNTTSTFYNSKTNNYENQNLFIARFFYFY
jgi:hypothetical protein